MYWYPPSFETIRSREFFLSLCNLRHLLTSKKAAAVRERRLSQLHPRMTVERKALELSHPLKQYAFTITYMYIHTSRNIGNFIQQIQQSKFSVILSQSFLLKMYSSLLSKDARQFPSLPTSILSSLSLAKELSDNHLKAPVGVSDLAPTKEWTKITSSCYTGN